MPDLTPDTAARVEQVIRAGRVYEPRALRAAVSDLDGRDRALAQRLAYGAVQRMRTLDHAIETLGRRRRRTRAGRRPVGALP